MEKQAAPTYAAIDVGSNTIHIVVARCFPSTLEILADELELVRIGESVTADGTISPAKTHAAIETLQKYRALAEQHGASRILVVATEAIRQASNNAEFISQVKDQTGLEVLLISGTAEAALTFWGATYEAQQDTHLGVMDLGGGSLELVVAWDMRINWRTSLPLGSGWLHDHYLNANPPASLEIEAAETFLRTYLRKLQPLPTLPRLIVTGGSANSLLYLAQKAFHFSEERQQLSQEDLARCQGLLSALAAEDISNLYGQPLARAKVLLAGTLIIRQIMHHLQIAEIMVSRHGIREGVLLAYTRHGEEWLTEANREDQKQATFAHSAHKVLSERLNTMLDWSEEVIKHEDREAVHKMRVASRRLRAALDAYEACCDPKSFKKVYRQIKKAANLLGEARDADVMLLYLSEQLTDLDETEQAGVRALMARLADHRQLQQQHLDAFLHDFDGEKLKHQLKASVQERTGK